MRFRAFSLFQIFDIAIDDAEQSLIACIIGVQTVGGEFFCDHGDLGLNAGNRAQIQHGAGKEGCVFANSVYVILLRPVSVTLIAGLGLGFAVEGSKVNDACGGIFVDQIKRQGIQRAVKGIGSLAAKAAHGGIAVAKVIGAAKNADEVGILGHIRHAADKVQIPTGVFRRGLLSCNACAANAEVQYLGFGM